MEFPLIILGNCSRKLVDEGQIDSRPINEIKNNKFPQAFLNWLSENFDLDLAICKSDFKSTIPTSFNLQQTEVV